MGCGKKDEMTNFIPTSIPEEEQSIDEDADTEATEDASDSEEDNDSATKEDNVSNTEEDNDSDTEDTTVEGDESAEVTQEPKTIHVGETTTKYVKLSQYGGYVNVRKSPSKDGEIIGFLVHAEKIEVVEIVDGWACFVQNNEKRYVSDEFLVDERPAYLTPPTPTPKPKDTPTPKATPTPIPDPNEDPAEI